MTDEQIRIAVAEACGLKNIAKHLVCEGTGMDFEEWYSGIPDKGGFAIPDYPNDLNASHEMEKVLIDIGRSGDWRGWDSYRITLDEMDGCELTLHATARQRCKAFLRTLGKWTEEPATQTK